MILTQASIPYDVTARDWKDGGFRDSYAWHKRVWEAFPGQPEASRNFLTRLDDTGNDFRLLILSGEPPTRPDWCPSQGWQSKTVENGFLEYSRYRFSLLVNPTRKKVVRDEAGNRKKNGRREPITNREQLICWMNRKGAAHGFSILDQNNLKTIPRPRSHFLKKGSGGTHHSVEFIGALEVTEKEVFRKAVSDGIGSAKAFGFGMLCLDPVNT